VGFVERRELSQPLVPFHFGAAAFSQAAFFYDFKAFALIVGVAVGCPVRSFAHEKVIVEINHAGLKLCKPTRLIQSFYPWKICGIRC
jgi:hypothetical protein